MNDAPTLRDQRSAESPVVALGVLAVAVGVLGVHAWSHLPFISDDALISLRYSQRLLDGHGLTWASGARVEGYTNLLWVLGCALLGVVGVDLIDAARVLGFLGMSATLAAIVYAFRPRETRSALPALVGAVGLALTGPMAVWTIGGLEQPFVAAFLAWALVWCMKLVEAPAPTWREALPASLMLGLICLTRSDGGVLCIGVAVGLIAARGFDARGLKLVFAQAIFPVLLGGGQIVFRLAYYGEWLPNPAHVKVAFTMDRVRDGWMYVRQAGPYLAGLMIPTVFAVILGVGLRELRQRTLLVGVPLGVWLMYVVMVGGDIFPAHRHWIPALICAAFVVANLTRWALAQPGHARSAALVGAILVAAITYMGQSRDPEVQRAREERWEWDGKYVGEMLHTAFGASEPLIACDPAGCIPYFSKLDAIDMMGLNDYHIARARTADFGKGVLGHELGDGKYILERKPDFILWTRPAGANIPLFTSAQQLNADPAFHQVYRLVMFRTPPPQSLLTVIWVRIDSPKVGIQVESGRIVIPAMFAASNEYTPAVLDDKGTLGVYTARGRLASLDNFGPPPGKWKARAEGDRPMLLAVRVPNQDDPIIDGLGEVTFTATAGTFYTFQFAPAGPEATLLRRIVLEPVNP